MEYRNLKFCYLMLFIFFVLQSGYLDVVVPPDILNHPEHNPEDGVCQEGGSISLMCSVTGVPRPKVLWRREAGKEIILRTDGRDKTGYYATFHI